jgi:hypothetical protein
MSFIIRYFLWFTLLIVDTYLWRAISNKRIMYDLSFSRDIIKLDFICYIVTVVLILMFIQLLDDLFEWITTR